MNKFFIILSILATGLIASSAFADNNKETNAPINSIKFNTETMILKVSGNLPNRCAASPRPQLVLTKDANTLVLGVVATQAPEACIDMIGGRYDLAFDIRSLKFDLIDLKINPDGVYTIISRDGTFSTVVDFSQATLNKSYATEEVAGGMFAVENNGRYVIVVSPTQAFHVNSPFIDMSKYVGQTVEVQGHALKAQAPQLGGDQAVQNSILVTGINITTY